MDPVVWRKLLASVELRRLERCSLRDQTRKSMNPPSADSLLQAVAGVKNPGNCSTCENITRCGHLIGVLQALSESAAHGFLVRVSLDSHRLHSLGHEFPSVSIKDSVVSSKQRVHHHKVPSVGEMNGRFSIPIRDRCGRGKNPARRAPRREKAIVASPHLAESELSQGTRGICVRRLGR